PFCYASILWFRVVTRKQFIDVVEIVDNVGWGGKVTPMKRFNGADDGVLWITIYWGGKVVIVDDMRVGRNGAARS
ncbi:hypothetical protein, partial [Brachybacterium alimentarium]|uniref:hypothetical protein n=1 Tax=Brachybacterium alimentarium TaxID=47845 RepID=UPI003FD05F3E